ncbi:MAG: low molecular weight protein arginine phosphatase [Clostridia bacterium]|nr:low molecular weight protein arginine phosphatase [Clostridia bacterium]
MVLYVCTGNTCRSYMAERVHIARFGPGTACSAGIAAFFGQAANELAIKALQTKGIDPGDHRARTVEHDAIRDADTVITMTAAQRDILHRAYPEHSEKIRTLHEACDVDDPFGFSQADYDACLAQILEYIDDHFSIG